MQIHELSRDSDRAQPFRRRHDIALAALVDRYGDRGGLASTDEVVRLMRPHWRQPISLLARWIVDRKVLSLPWYSQILLPAFQFESPRMTPCPLIADCSREFGDLVDDLGLATWFAQPSEWLNGNAPLDLFESRPESVVEAAARTRHGLAMRRVAH